MAERNPLFYDEILDPATASMYLRFIRSHLCVFVRESVRMSASACGRVVEIIFRDPIREAFVCVRAPS